jgi:epoxyqueuosine reductase
MLIDIELEADQQLEERCGSCKLCINSCPTQAIVSDKVINCRKCLTNYTIEKNVRLTDEIKTAIKNTGYIFGCDICQDVCPYNKKRQTEKQVSFDFFYSIALNDIATINENDFNHIFQHSPLVRTGYKRMLEYIMLC